MADKNGNKQNILYLLHLRSSNDLIQSITLKQSVASDHSGYGT